MKVLKALPTKVKTQNPDQTPDVACKVQQAESTFISQPALTMLLATLAFLKFLECIMPPQSLGIAVPSFWNAIPLLPPPFIFSPPVELKGHIPRMPSRDSQDLIQSPCCLFSKLPDSVHLLPINLIIAYNC